MTSGVVTIWLSQVPGSTVFPRRVIPMRWFAVLVLCLAMAPASAQSVTVVVSAQEHASHLAATGGFSHCNRRGGGYEGLGFSTASPEAAVRRSCFWGQRPVKEVATAWCPRRRGWVAVVRYH